MEIVPGQTYLFNITSEEQAKRLIKACRAREVYVYDYGMFSGSLAELNGVIRGNESRLMCNPAPESLEKGIWIDVEKFIETSPQPKFYRTVRLKGREEDVNVLIDRLAVSCSSVGVDLTEEKNEDGNS